MTTLEIISRLSPIEGFTARPFSVPVEGGVCIAISWEYSGQSLQTSAQTLITDATYSDDEVMELMANYDVGDQTLLDIMAGIITLKTQFYEGDISATADILMNTIVSIA